MKALILIDLQNDFLPGGALPVPQGDEIIPLANELQAHFNLVVATQDWHPANHSCFAANHPGRKPGDVVTIKGRKQTLQRVHCVQRTEGAKLAPNLRLTRVNRVFTKGTDAEIDSYSAFFDYGHVKSTGLGIFLKSRRIRDVYLAGLATDSCVKFTALDARSMGFRTFLIKDACRGMNSQPDDVSAALEEMKAAKVKFIHSSAVLKSPAEPRSPKPKPRRK